MAQGPFLDFFSEANSLVYLIETYSFMYCLDIYHSQICVCVFIYVQVCTMPVEAMSFPQGSPPYFSITIFEIGVLSVLEFVK